MMVVKNIGKIRNMMPPYNKPGRKGVLAPVLARAAQLKKGQGFTIQVGNVKGLTPAKSRISVSVSQWRKYGRLTGKYSVSQNGSADNIIIYRSK